MSKISYCSLEEAWGDSYKTNNIDNIDNINNINNDIISNKNIINNKKNTENNKINTRDKYTYLNENSEIERKEIINNMNNIERNNNTENNSIVEYEKYRFNPTNKVNNNNSEKQYSPFNESIEKKYLQDKLNFLENEFRKYKNYFENESNTNNYIENFSNNSKKYEENETNYNKSNDIIDLILLIIIGLIVIFVMNSIFTIGKSIGARNKVI
jgi:hypothetical protein